MEWNGFYYSKGTILFTTNLYNVEGEDETLLNGEQTLSLQRPWKHLEEEKKVKLHPTELLKLNEKVPLTCLDGQSQLHALRKKLLWRSASGEFRKNCL